jgi:molybdenum cofactor guanylyltransferase
LKLTHVEAAVLCGGASKRMGRDKATLLYRGEPLALRVANALGACFARVRLVAKSDLRPALGIETIVERNPEHASIVGVHAALAACEASAVFVAACDLPHADPRLALALAALAPVDGGADAIAPIGPSGPEPLFAIYRPRLLPELERRIAARDFALRALLGAVKCTFVPEAELRALDPELASLRNLNRPEDLSADGA